MKLAIVFITLFALAFANDLEAQFQNWRVQNHKFYANSNEYAKRYAIYAQNDQRIKEFNTEDHSYTVGHNKFSDLTNAEYRAIYLMTPLEDNTVNTEYHVSGASSPDEVDHRKDGIVNAVKDQGQCGSCYSFGAVASMEGAWAQAGHPLASFSEQQILDCSWSTGNQGCNGGWHNWAMDYVIAQSNAGKGIDSEASYSYRAAADKNCRYVASGKAGTIKSRLSIANSEASLKDAVAQHVVAIAIDASHWSFQMYKNGIYNEPACSSTSLDHAVAAVGYGTLNGKDYWLVRNSWGASWGDQGYILMSRNAKNQCGVSTKAFAAVA